MLDKVRNDLIASAFRKANITSLESEPTAAEIADAAHALNVMLQSWNNDGFRLFKIKTGYMPFLPKKQEYSLATQAYKSFETCDVTGFERIGATKISLNNWSNVAEGQKIIVLNNTINQNQISEVDFDNKVITLKSPMQQALYDGNFVFYGQSFNVAQTEEKTFNTSFQTISFNNQTVLPEVGDYIFVCVSGSWVLRQVYSVDTIGMTITLDKPLAQASITSSYIFYGTSVFVSSLSGDYPIQPRCVISQGLDTVPYTIGIIDYDNITGTFDVESAEVVSSDSKTVKLYLKQPLDENILLRLGKEYIDAKKDYPEKTLLLWSEILSLAPVNELDWGSVTDSSSLVTDDWGSILDAATVLTNWGTLTGNVRITGFGKSANDLYATVYDEDESKVYLFCKLYGQDWSAIDVTAYSFTDASICIANNTSYLFDASAGVYELNSGMLNQVYSANGVEKIIKFKNAWYLVSPKAAGTTTRTVVSTTDFTDFSTSWTINLNNVSNPAEFLNKLYIGTTDTFVTLDMKVFSDIGVYSQNRCVIGDRLLNMNTGQYCSFTKDGVTFQPMPLMISNQSAWGYKDGCTFIAVYGFLIDGIVGTQIYTANDFNPVWTPQLTVKGRVFDIQFDSQNAYFVSDVEVRSLEYRDSIMPINPLLTYAFGEQIGRPQELMNVVKYGIGNQTQLPMNALALKDFSLLPQEALGGEPVNYCFLRDAKDGKMMVWGTPTKFGEYLKFSYVEPLALLENARSTPDFPDEYYEAVEDGLASQLASDYGLPLERQAALAARAEASKENAILHDNEDTSYSIAPNERWR